VKGRVLLVTIGLALALAGSAHAKEGAVARVRGPLPDAPPGTPITIAWSLVFPEDKDHPFNACGVFVQLRGASGAAPTRGYADGGDCRAHLKGEYDATVVVPEGGIGEIEIGLSGTTDVFFPVVVATASPPPSPSRTDRRANQGPIGALIGLVVAATCVIAYRRMLRASGVAPRGG
jgi:hypothetical protein